VKKSTLFILFGLLSVLSGCVKDEVNLPDQRLQGSVGKEAWEYDKANGFLQADLTYQVRFISNKEPVSDPCTLPRPGLPHVKAVFKPAIGSFSVNTQVLADDQVQVAFELSPSTTITAVSGFMEIYDINNNVVLGYLQAALDEDNTVEGSFQLRLCQ